MINFEKIGPDPPPITEKLDEKDENGASKEEFNEQVAGNERIGVQNANTSWYNCRKMIYVPRTPQNKGYPLGQYNKTTKKQTF